MALLLEEKVLVNRLAFTAEVKNIAVRLGINADYLMIIMYMESGLRADAVNPTTGATGLIQFMPATASGLGTSTAALKMMSNVAQLHYVYKYFLPAKGRLKSLYDLYMWVFFPAMLGKSDNWVLQTTALSASIIAKQNPAINLNKDHQITVAEFKQYIDNFAKKKGLPSLK